MKLQKVWTVLEELSVFRVNKRIFSLFKKTAVFLKQSGASYKTSKKRKAGLYDKIGH